MREYGKIHVRYYTHKDIQPLPDAAKLLGAYLLTGPHSNSFGCYRLPFAYVAGDLLWSEDKVKKNLKLLIEIQFAYYDNDVNWIILPQYLRFNPPKNDNVGKFIEKIFFEIPSEFKYYFTAVNSLLKYAKRKLKPEFRNHLETVSELFRNNNNNNNNDNNNDNDNEKVNFPSEPLTSEADGSPPPPRLSEEDQLEFLKERYPDRKLIDEAIKALSTTRKNGKIKTSLLIAIMQKWEQKSISQVVQGITIYLDGGYAAEGKDERYLWGIIRGQKYIPDLEKPDKFDKDW